MTVPLVEWAVAEKAYPGETRSGDSCTVLVGDERAMIGVVDGVGHGDEAADVAAAAIETIERHATESVERLFMRCHERLSGTRGAALTLVSYDGTEGQLTWLGAGNVTAALVQLDDSADQPLSNLLVRSGLVGSRLPHSFSSSSAPISPGDVLILTTDGIRKEFLETVRPRENLQHQADRILEEFHCRNDDALVLVARLNGAGADR